MWDVADDKEITFMSDPVWEAHRAACGQGAVVTADCSMIEAFKVVGDFHSRTSLWMLKYIQDAVENKKQ